MHTLSVKGLSFALGAGFAVLYLGCAFVMITVPKDAAVRFFNSIMHGVDVTPIVRWDMPLAKLTEACCLAGAFRLFFCGSICLRNWST